MKEPFDPTIERYLNGDYAKKNPDWDSIDSSWKAGKVHEILDKNRVQPKSIVEVGCGSGAVLVALKQHYPGSTLTGYDIAPDAQPFWEEFNSCGIRFELADYLTLSEPAPDVLLLLDVLEHLGNPWTFLSQLHSRTKMIVVHFPLDLSAISVIRESPLLKVRDKVGHLHFYTLQLALTLLEESGYEIIEARYTGAGINAPQRSFKTRMAGLLRSMASTINRDVSARILGGETLMVLARPRDKNCS